MDSDKIDLNYPQNIKLGPLKPNKVSGLVPWPTPIPLATLDISSWNVCFVSALKYSCDLMGERIIPGGVTSYIMSECLYIVSIT